MHLAETAFQSGYIHTATVYIYIYIYAFSRRFYPKRLTLHSSYSFYILSALAFPGNRTHALPFELQESLVFYYMDLKTANRRKVLIWAVRGNKRETTCIEHENALNLELTADKTLGQSGGKRPP